LFNSFARRLNTPTVVGETVSKIESVEQIGKTTD